MSAKINLSKADIHPHLRARMVQRGVTKEEIEKTLEKGGDARDAKLGTYGKVLIFLYNDYWEGKFYEQKEITVYYKIAGKKTMILRLFSNPICHSEPYGRRISF